MIEEIVETSVHEYGSNVVAGLPDDQKSNGKIPPPPHEFIS